MKVKLYQIAAIISLGVEQMSLHVQVDWEGVDTCVGPSLDSTNDSDITAPAHVASCAPRREYAMPFFASLCEPRATNSLFYS